MSEIELRLLLEDEEDLAGALDAADAQGGGLTAEVVPVEGGGGVDVAIEPVTMIIIGAGVLASAQFLRNLWENWRGGLIIDQRPGADNAVYRHRALPAGYILIYPSDGGAVQIQVNDAPKDSTDQLISQVVSGVFKTAEAAAEAAAKIIGKDKVEKSETTEDVDGGAAKKI